MRRRPPSDDRVVVVGAGPAAWAAAAAFAAAGGRGVTLVAPDPHRPWRATYAAFEDHLAGLDLPPPRRRWAEAIVVGTTTHRAGPYVQLDNAALQGDLVGRFEQAGGTVVDASATSVEPGRVTLAGGARLTAGLVVDATGPPAGWRAAQRAVGLVARFDTPPGPAGAAVLMDWSHWPDHDPTPTFLYALDLDDGWWLVEETSLAADPPLDLELLAARLSGRLAAQGTPAREIADVEHVHIPLDAPIGPSAPGLLRLGAAGGHVHPATGYSVAASLRAATEAASRHGPELAVRRGPVGGGAAGAGARPLLLATLGVLLGLDQGDARRFFDAFFRLDPADRHRFLAPSGPGDVLAAGAALFAASPWPIRRRLADPRALSRPLWSRASRPRRSAAPARTTG